MNHNRKHKKGRLPPKEAAPLIFEDSVQKSFSSSSAAQFAKARGAAQTRLDNPSSATSFEGMSLPQEREFFIEDIAPGGQAIARSEGKIFFLDLGVPGQTVRAKITEYKKGIYFAQRLQVLSPAPNQAEPFCPYFGLCGGCQWQEMPYPEQLALKTRHVQDSLSRLGGFEALKINPCLPSPKQQHFRGKLEFAFAALEDKKRKIIAVPGLRQRSSHNIVPVSFCPVGCPEINQVLGALGSWLAECGLAPFEDVGLSLPCSGPASSHLSEANSLPELMSRQVFGPGSGPQRNCNTKAAQSTTLSSEKVLRFFNVRASAHSGHLAVQLITSPAPAAGKRFEALGRALLALPFVTSFTHSVREAPENIAQGEKEIFSLGDKFLRERLGQVEFDLSPESFFQTNIGAAEILQQKVLEFAALSGEEEVWDIYSGAGAIALSLAPFCRQVFALELSPAATADARHNADLNNIRNCVFKSGDVRELIRSLPGSPQVVVLDPPRSGLDREVIKTLLLKKIPRLIYVSCNPATLARDLALLAAKYEVQAVQPLDMFPHTPHVECIILLQRKM